MATGHVTANIHVSPFEPAKNGCETKNFSHHLALLTPLTTHCDSRGVATTVENLCAAQEIVVTIVVEANIAFGPCDRGVAGRRQPASHGAVVRLRICTKLMNDIGTMLHHAKHKTKAGSPPSRAACVFCLTPTVPLAGGSGCLGTRMKMPRLAEGGCARSFQGYKMGTYRLTAASWNLSTWGHCTERERGLCCQANPAAGQPQVSSRENPHAIAFARSQRNRTRRNLFTERRFISLRVANTTSS